MRRKCGTGGIIKKLANGDIDYVQYANPIASVVDILGNQGGYNGVGSSALSYGIRGAAAGAALGPIGAGVGAGIGAAVGGITAAINKQKYMEEMRRQKNNELSQRRRIGASTVDVYPVHGSSTTDYYANGGIRSRGGALIPLSKRAKLAHGNTHEQGGIKVEPNLEVEDQEVKVEMPGYDVWFSNRIGVGGKTFAQHAQQIAADYASNEQAKRVGSMYSRGSAERNIQKLDSTVETLAVVQDRINGRPNRVAANGTIVPYLDNIVNAAVTANYPTVPNLQRSVAYELPTTVNVQDRIDSIESQVAGAQSGLQRSTSNSANLRGNLVGLRTQAMQQLDSVLVNKQNIEQELLARNVQNKQAVTNSNVGITNQERLMQYERRTGIAGEISANAANAVEDARVQQLTENQERKDAAEIALLQNYYKTYGIYDRTVNDDLQLLMSGKISVDEFRKRMSAKNVPAPPSTPPTGVQIGSADDLETVTNFMYSRVR